MDELNKIYLMDKDTLVVYNAIGVGKRIYIANGLTHIYVHMDRALLVYDWNLNLMERMELALNWVSTSILEMGAKLIITDGYGNVHTFYPQSLKNN